MIRPARAIYFPRAGDYAGERKESPANIRDPRSAGRTFDYSERHLQAIWFDPRWRPASLKTYDGEDVMVESPGNWNLEAGPDFTGACIVAGSGRRITGDVEVHVFPGGWKQHGHDRDPRYRNVCLHLTYFEGTVAPGLLPPGALQVALRPVLRADAGFAFEHVDVSAYPYAGRADEPPCRRQLAGWSIDDRAAFLEAAGHARLRIKSDRLHTAIVERGVDQVFFEQLMTALGYQHNKLPFARVAALAPWDRLRTLTSGDSFRAMAILAGVGGLLPVELRGNWDEETRACVRTLWDCWWKVESQFAVRLDARAWHLRGVRPANHPLRRLAAAARLVAGSRGAIQLLESWVAGDPASLVERIESSFVNQDADYWSYRYVPGGRKSRAPLALLGRDRCLLIALNVVIPMAAACGFAPQHVDALLRGLNAEPDNQIIRQTAFYLLGRDYPSRVLADPARLQGLQQIFHDYCLNDRSRCAACSLPEKLAGYKPCRTREPLA